MEFVDSLVAGRAVGQAFFYQGLLLDGSCLSASRHSRHSHPYHSPVTLTLTPVSLSLLQALYTGEGALGSLARFADNL